MGKFPVSTVKNCKQKHGNSRSFIFLNSKIKDNVYTQDQRMKQREVEGKLIQAN